MYIAVTLSSRAINSFNLGYLLFYPEVAALMRFFFGSICKFLVCNFGHEDNVFRGWTICSPCLVLSCVRLHCFDFLCFEVCVSHSVSCFLFSNFYRLDLHNQTWIALTNVWWSISKNRIENQTSFDLVMGTGSACLFDFLINYLGLPKCIHPWVWSSQ